MDETTKQLIKEFAQSLGTTSEEVFQILVQQVSRGEFTAEKKCQITKLEEFFSLVS
jgi:hypothetical protein